MPQVTLNQPQIYTGFYQVGCLGMTQGVRRRRFPNPVYIRRLCLCRIASHLHFFDHPLP